MNKKRAMIFDIQRFSIHDGPGIRTTVFLKGCPLKCLWCHNPESGSSGAELMLYPNRCVGCGNCVSACPKGLHEFLSDGTHTVLREKCEACGACAAVCAGAISLCGREMGADEVMAEVMKDKAFYENSGGGMTVSGGEPLMHADFTLELLKDAKAKGLHTAIETSGFAKWETLSSLVEYIDLFLWDVKETDSELHKRFTGVGNELILDNLHRLNGMGAKIVLRCPVIPGCNDRDGHFEAIGRLAESLSGVERVDVEPYHPLGKSKAEALDKNYALGDVASPDDETVRSWCEKISEFTSKSVERS